MEDKYSSGIGYATSLALSKVGAGVAVRASGTFIPIIRARKSNCQKRDEGE
jgi:hypothetical protein